MDSINTILGNRDFKEPEDVEKLQSYIESVYGYRPAIRVSPKGLVVIVPSGSLANTLRLDMPNIKRKAGVCTQVYLRIS